VIIGFVLRSTTSVIMKLLLDILGLIVLALLEVSTAGGEGGGCLLGSEVVIYVDVDVVNEVVIYTVSQLLLLGSCRV
jgi:hypothetical protein